MKTLLPVVVLFLTLNASADTLFLTCKRDTQDSQYEIKVYQTAPWEKVGRGDDRSENRTEVIKLDRSGQKSVRNYNHGDMHRYPGERRMWIALSRKRTSYGQINLELGARKSIKSATLELFEGRDSRNLELACKFEK